MHWGFRAWLPKRPQWTVYDLKYIFIGTLLTASVLVIRNPPWPVRLVLSVLLLVATVTPYIRRFIVPALPIITWLVTFYAYQFVPLEYRPHHIFVNLLPTLERILYGASLSEEISKHTHPVLDVLAWLPYGVIHFSLPFIFAAILFTFGPPGSLNIFGQAFGYMNIAGVLTQTMFPNASPWYEMTYGSTPANYTVPGEPGGLARIDEILGLSLYGSSFGASPLVFGAFPSLHSGSATMEMLFVVYLCPKLWPLGVAYTMWMWWSTMYLTHHYLIDLVGGSIYSVIVFFIARRFLPPVDPEKRTRLDYLGIPPPFRLRTLLASIEAERLLAAESMARDDEEALLKHADVLDTSDSDDDTMVAEGTDAFGKPMPLQRITSVPSLSHASSSTSPSPSPSPEPVSPAPTPLLMK